MREIWRIELFGGLKARHGERVVGRFRTQKTAALLAYLAYHRHRSHSREALIELLWPEAELDSARHSLSLSLSSLRHQLEPPGVPPGAVIIADRWSVELNPESFGTDVTDFEQELRLAAQARKDSARARHLSGALERYTGRLLAGFYEDWVLREQERLAERYVQATRELTSLLEREGDLGRGVELLRAAVAVEPLREELHADLMRLLAATGSAEAALRQFRELERVLDDELGESPSSPTRKLARQIEEQRDRMAPSSAASPAPARAVTHRPPPPAGGYPASAPHGTVTFLLTDVERSTQLLERHGEAGAGALRLHQSLLRREFRRNGGYEFKEAGDSFLVAFASAGDALACAVAGQRALAAAVWPEGVEPPRVRMALHSGDAQFEDGDYRGLVLHRASRILAAAHGGQVLASEVACALLRRDLETEVHLRDMGLHRLRDVEDVDRLYQVEYSGMAQREFPSLRAERAHAGNLPPQLTRFFGREREIAELQELLTGGEARLITLTGPGGTGKSRLAVEAAGRLQEAFSGAVWFAPLSDLVDPRLIPEAVLSALDAAPAPGREPLEQAAEALGLEPSLLILDNLEQLVESGGTEMVQELLSRAPRVRCLVTSRQLLGLPGERDFPVPPLPTPGAGGDPERLSVYESVRLFVDRAQAVRPDFQVTNTNAPAVAELCNRLEGIPLALELAAARAQVLSPAQMLQQLERRFDFLVSRRRGVAERQRALRATVDWSYRLLSPPLQRFFARLSVFRGGCTAETAEAVCGEPLALDHLAQLRECSLLLTEDGPHGIRFRMLESLREYAAELAGAERSEAETRHTQFFLDLAESGEAELRGEHQAEWLDRLETEHDNLRAAMRRANDEGGKDERGPLRFCAALWYFWSIRGHITEGRRVVADALAMLPAEERGAARAGGLLAAGALAHDQSDFAAAEAALRESVALRRELGDSPGLAHPLNCLANVLLDSERPDEAFPLYQEALGLYREAGDSRGASIALSNLGVLHQQRGDLSRAVELLTESVRLKRKLGNRYGLANSLDSLGNVERERANTVPAQELYEEALALRRELGHKQGIGISLNNLGALLLETGDPPAAAAHFREALALFEELQEPRGLAEAESGLARVSVAEN